MGATLSVIGCGAVGRTLARALRESGYTLGGLVCRRPASAERATAFVGGGEVASDPVAAAGSADIVLITTPDSAVSDVCRSVAAEGGFREGQTVLHCSGALTSVVLKPARDRGAAVGALHPLQSFSRSEEALKSLPGTYFSFEGDDTAFETARGMVAALKGHILRIEPGAKPLYHAACVAASNYVVAVTDMAVGLLSQCGVGKDEALSALLPLIRGTAWNLGRVGLPGALTGPIERGDVDTVERHLAALSKQGPDVMDLYCTLGLKTLRVAEAKGTLNRTQARRIQNVLTERRVSARRS